VLRRSAAPKGSDAIRSQNDAIPRIIRQTIPLMSISDIPLHKDNNARCQAFVSVSVSFLFSLQCSTFIFSFWSLCCCYNCNYVIVIMMCKSIDGCMSYPPDKTTSPTLDSIFIGPDESHKSRWLNSNGRHLPRISSVCQLIKRNFYGLK